MALYSFKIGLTTGTLTNLEDLTSPVPPPAWTFKPYLSEIVLGDGSVRGMGSPAATWHWGYLKKAARTQLKTFCTGRSSEVYIQTYQDDRSTKIFLCQMIWPPEEEDVAERTIDFTLEFRRMIEVTV